MSTFYTSCMHAVRNLPQGSALDAPWGWMEEQGLSKGIVFSKEKDLTEEAKITHTSARFFFAILLPTFAKPFGVVNLGLGATHLVWCVMNIHKIRNNEDGCSSQDVEKALIRLFTGVYDLAIAYLLCSSFMRNIYGKWTIPLFFAFGPSYVIWLHRRIFEKAKIKIEMEVKEGEQKKFKYEIDHRALEVGCLIKQFCSGLVKTFIPPPASPPSLKRRLSELPEAMATFVKISYQKIQEIPT